MLSSFWCSVEIRPMTMTRSFPSGFLGRRGTDGWNMAEFLRVKNGNGKEKLRPNQR